MRSSRGGNVWKSALGVRFQQTLNAVKENLFLGGGEPLKVFDDKTDLRCQHIRWK